MKKLLEYIAIPAAIKIYLVLGIILFKIKEAKATFAEYRLSFSKPSLKHASHS